jgi:hypothetical protein
VNFIEFEAQGYTFEFSPNSTITKGDLHVRKHGDETDTPYGQEINLAGKKSRKDFVQEATEVYPEVFDDEQALLRGLVELHAYMVEQREIVAARKAVEADEGEDDVEVVEVPDDRRERAMNLLKCKDILRHFSTATTRLGHVGETSNKKLAFISAISAQFGRPIQNSTHGESSSGKNHLWNTVLSLVPPELVYQRSGFSAKALFRTDMSLKGKILYIKEAKGVEDAEYSIRVLQSEGRLEWEVPEKGADGVWKNVVYTKEGPTVVVQTTTLNHLHHENETRVLPLYLDESEEQTERITKVLLRRATGTGALSPEEEDRLKERWHDAIRLLEPAEVVIPFAERIETPVAPVRIRRDIPRLLDLIRVIAWLHQYSRERDARGRIKATEDDFNVALNLAIDSFARGWKKLTPAEERVFGAIKNHIPKKQQRHAFKRSHVEKALADAGEKMPPRTVQSCLKTLTSNGYLESDGRGGASGATYTLASTRSEHRGTISLAEPLTPSTHLRVPDESAQNVIGKPNQENENAQHPSCAFLRIARSEDNRSGERANAQERANDPLRVNSAGESQKPKNAQTRKEGMVIRTRGGDVNGEFAFVDAPEQ